MSAQGQECGSRTRSSNLGNGSISAAPVREFESVVMLVRFVGVDLAKPSQSIANVFSKHHPVRLGALLERYLGLGCLSVICLPQSSACQRSLVEVRPTIPVCTLVGSVGLCVRLGLSGASNP